MSWKVTTLGRAGTWVSGGTPSTSNPDYWGGDIPWMSAKSMTEFRVSTSDRRLTTLGVRNGTKLVGKDVVLMVVRGMSLKSEFRVGVTQRDVALSQDLKGLIPSADFEPLFLAYALRARTVEVLGMVDEAGHGTGRLQSDRLFGIEIPMPPPSEQRAIAGVLNALDDKIAANDRVLVIADELARAQFLAALKLNGDARTVALGDLAAAGALELGDGYRTKRSEHGQDGFRIVRAGDISGGRVDMTGPDFVASDYERQIGPKILKAGDVVLTTKGTVGRVAVVPDGVERATYSPQLCYFRVVDRSRIVPAYLAGWLKSDDLQGQIAVRMFNSDMAPYVNLKDVRSLAIPIPSVEVQQQIGQRQDALQQLAHTCHNESRRLAAVQNELLPLLMSGQVRIRDLQTTVEGVL